MGQYLDSGANLDSKKLQSGATMDTFSDHSRAAKICGKTHLFILLKFIKKKIEFLSFKFRSFGGAKLGHLPVKPVIFHNF